MSKIVDFLLSRKGAIIMIILIVVSLGVILIATGVNTNEKTPLTCQQVSAKLDSLGYSATDTSYAYSDKNPNFEGSIAVETPNIRFDFFEFNNDDSSFNLFNNSHEQIYAKRTHPFTEQNEHYNNYAIYSMSTTDMYYIAIWIGNTEIDASCDYEYKNELLKILETIGY